ncbi:putative bifunctional diguanylate cyclase/phosphodiesterase [Oceanisphaera avium]|nr:bifunctional diguanylate cyclase/phosphodiesterase [Oceanisphaera avium]
MRSQGKEDATISDGIVLVVQQSDEWRKLCQQIVVLTNAQQACFIFFATNTITVIASDHKPSIWSEDDYRQLLKENQFYQLLDKPKEPHNNYVAIPIKRGELTALLLLTYVNNQPAAPSFLSLKDEQTSLLDILALQGALLWQEQHWYGAAAHGFDNEERPVPEVSSGGLFKRLKQLFHQAPILVNAFDAQGRCILWNQACEKTFGWSRAEIKSHPSPFLLFYPDGEERQRMISALHTSNHSEFVEWRPFNRAGQRLTILWAHVSLPHGGALCVGHDISQQIQALNEQRLAANVFESSYDGIVISDPHHRITHINSAFTRITGFTPADIIGRSPYQPTHIVFESKFYLSLREQLKTQDYWHGELNGRRKNDEQCILRLAVTVVRDEKGQVVNHVTILSDITHLKQHENNLKHQAFHDSLTGIPNRLLFGELLERAITTNQRNQSQLAVCYLDLDGFKLVNDSFGHAAGDNLLIEVSQRLAAITRGCDAVARLGGDEFVLLFSGLNSKQECDSILQRVKKVICEPVILDEGVVTISASIGVALYPQDADEAELLLRYADQAMYQAKAQGKNDYVFFDVTLQQQARSATQRLEQLQEGFRRGEFLLHYQPAIDLKTQQVIRLEALLRWSHPELGLLAPADFLPVLNGSYLELELGLWVVKQILEQLQLWQAQGLTLTVSINVGTGQLLHKDFVNQFSQLLALYPSSFSRLLALEFQEKALLSDVQAAMAVLQCCRDLGVSTTLDNFGLGHASLNHLHQLPLDAIKIDRSFISDLLTNQRHVSLVQSVIQLAAALKLGVTAEGVEKHEQSDRLQELGCFQIQGYGVALPMPAEQVQEWLGVWERSDKRLGQVQAK